MQKIQEYTVFGRQIVYVIAGDIVTVVLGIIQIPIITRALGSSQYGIWALIITAISLLIPFTGLSFSMSIIRFLAAEKDTDKIREDFLFCFHSRDAGGSRVLILVLFVFRVFRKVYSEGC